MYTDEGITGLGEGATLGPFYCGESQETIMGIIAGHLFPKVLEGEDPFNIDPIHFKMNKVVYGNTVAKAAVDYAIHDIMGKTLGVPLYKLLGGKFCDKIPTRASVGIDDPDKMAAKAAHVHKLGFGGISKLKVGLDPSGYRACQAIRKAVRPRHADRHRRNGAYRTKDPSSCQTAWRLRLNYCRTAVNATT
jgi:L-alanine-DL-glutamate epimerase-like enolase superfamily enzyme